MLPEFEELDRLRLERDWTFAELAADMARVTGNRMVPRTLHYLCKRAPLDATPRDRTLHKVRRYLERARQRARRRAAAARRRQTPQ